ncbi:hypothetical protein [Kutzneria buriramensis]|uniref:MarR family transcriptional regulator n=1 Tax=Kutzneria buriramensis TaxID=1045776 RepID=A0A3E0HIL1_9PSEU|nr:hypothetical protein [Kutzneria buriramensis]REH46036.1 hypothetical protein BCF44_107168 [Kutzneria buriramensis]
MDNSRRARAGPATCGPRRIPDPSDARARLVTVTPKGMGLVELGIPVIRAIGTAWENTLGRARMRQLKETLTALRAITDPFHDADS